MYISVQSTLCVGQLKMLSSTIHHLLLLSAIIGGAFSALILSEITQLPQFVHLDRTKSTIQRYKSVGGQIHYALGARVSGEREFIQYFSV